jgi:two-component sensor histidine kinase
MPLYSVSSPQSQAPSSPTSEADGRIANNFTVISGLVRVRARATKDVADPQTFLLEIADRIDTAAMLHRLLAYSNTGIIRLNEVLNEICDKLAGAFATVAPSYSITCSPEQLVPFNMALPLGLITAELFSNSLKYAHPAGLPVKISVSCGRTPASEIMFTYEDDGVGFPEAFDVTHDGHLGMQFIRLLSEQLEGACKWLSDPLGIRFEIIVPMRAESWPSAQQRERP